MRAAAVRLLRDAVHEHGTDDLDGGSDARPPAEVISIFTRKRVRVPERFHYIRLIRRACSECGAKLSNVGYDRLDEAFFIECIRGSCERREFFPTNPSYDA